MESLEVVERVPPEDSVIPEEEIHVSF